MSPTDNTSSTDNVDIQTQLAQLQEQVAIAQRYINQIQNTTGIGVGSTTPTQTRGGIAVPPVNALSAKVISSSVGQDNVLATWTSPVNRFIDHYNVYSQKTIQGQNTSTLVAAVSDSPAVFGLTPDNNVPAIILVQTVLTNGQVLPIAKCPSTSLLVTAPTISPSALGVNGLFISGLTFTDNSPSSGSIAWSSCVVTYNSTNYTITAGNTANQYVYWDVGNLTFTGSTDYVTAATRFLIATNSFGVHDTGWDKVAAAGVKHEAINFPAILIGPNGLLTYDSVFSSNTTTQAVSWTAGNVVYKGHSYQIPAFSTTDFFVYWDLSSPTSFQHSTTFPSISGDDGFIIGENTQDPSTLNFGRWSPVIEGHGSSNLRALLHSRGIEMYNDDTNFLSSLTRATAGGSLLQLADGSGTGSLGGGRRIIATGADGKIQMGTFEINRSNATVDINFKNMSTSSATAGGAGTIPDADGYLEILVNGSAKRIPYCNP